MNRRFLLALGLLVVAPLQAAGPANQALLDAQRKALAPMALFDGLWRGEASWAQPDGSTLKMTQTERVGPMLGGSVRVVEGRGYDAEGRLVFNAFALISHAAHSGRTTIRSQAQGYGGEFPMEMRADGYSWTAPAGPAQIRYTATLVDGQWVEIGERLVPGQAPQRIFEMKLRRVGDTDWPAGGAIGP